MLTFSTIFQHSRYLFGKKINLEILNRVMENFDKRNPLNDLEKTNAIRHGSPGDTKNEEIKLINESFRDYVVGLELQELLKYANDPFWVRLRIIFLLIFAFIWSGLLVSTIVVIVLSPKCPPMPKQEWWETAMVYCIQPKSFLDSDGDGIGDIKGIHSKLSYIKDTLNADAINLGIIQRSSGKSTLNSDVVNFSELHEQFGGIQDFQNLCSAIHKKGMKLILDFVPNHSSDKHPWFLASKNRAEPYSNFYIWHPGAKDERGNSGPPNNLTNVYGQPAWTYDDTREEYYYHTYSIYMPDLNLTNEDVVTSIDKAIMYWLRLNVDGIKILGGNYLVENKDISNANFNSNDGITSLPDIMRLINHWRQLVDNQTNQFRVQVLMVDMDIVPANLTLYFPRNGSESSNHGPHLLINRNLLKLNSSCSADFLSFIIEGWFVSNGRSWKNSNWMISDSSSSRIVSRLRGTQLLNAINLLLLTLPGSLFLYYGEEIGMSDRKTRHDGRHEESISFRPMQWNDQENAGFSSAEPWVSVADDYLYVNVEAQKDPECGKLNAFSKLATLRKEPSIRFGNFSFSTSYNIFYYVRRASGFPTILIALNLGPTASSVDFRKGKLADDISAIKAIVVASTYNFDGERSKLFSNNSQVDLDISICLKPGEGLVLKWIEE